jgi:hypothetical protein
MAAWPSVRVDDPDLVEDELWLHRNGHPSEYAAAQLRMVDQRREREIASRAFHAYMVSRRRDAYPDAAEPAVLAPMDEDDDPSWPVDDQPDADGPPLATEPCMSAISVNAPPHRPVLAPMGAPAH